MINRDLIIIDFQTVLTVYLFSFIFTNNLFDIKEHLKISYSWLIWSLMNH